MIACLFGAVYLLVLVLFVAGVCLLLVFCGLLMVFSVVIGLCLAWVGIGCGFGVDLLWVFLGLLDLMLAGCLMCLP